MRNPWFDKLTMTVVTLSMSKGGFLLEFIPYSDTGQE
jgi:hypothetical protein